MKKLLLFSIGLLVNTVFAQVGIGTDKPDASAALEISSTDKGVLLPRLTTVQREGIPTPADGLIIYDTDEGRIYHYNATQTSWEKITTRNDTNGNLNIPDIGTGTGKDAVKNIIFMIGDGMSYAQVYAAYVKNGMNLTMTSFPYTGIVRTLSADNLTTDSAAGGTALGSGVKTNNYSVGKDANGDNVNSILTEAKFNGLSAGIVVTSSLTNATPASFYAHQSDRGLGKEIAEDFLTSDFDVAIGGINTHFNNIVNNLETKGYQVVYDLKNITKKKVVGLLGTLNQDVNGRGNPLDEMPKRGNMLSQATTKALDILKTNEKGFVLMVEGSQIDWAGHAVRGEYMIEEMLDFDNAITVARDFAEKHGNTLVVVTADHETGGLLVYNDKSLPMELNFHYTGNINGAIGGHTAVPVPVFSYGPGAQYFSGFFDNTEFKGKFMKLLKLKYKE